MALKKQYPVPPYPNGWFRVAFSDEIPLKSLKPVRYFGQDLIVFRGEDGQAHVLDAYCAHIGAHLGMGGTIVGNTVQCPFHGWRYDGCGTCVEVPNANKIPAGARMRSWPVAERNGIIFVYHHAQALAPDFEIPPLEEFECGRYSHGHTGRVIRAHIQETQENMVDMGHFTYIHHGFRELPRITEWQENGRHCKLVISSITFLGPFSTPSTVTFDVYGVGCQVVHVDATIQFTIVFVITPIDEESIDFHCMVLYKRNRIPFGGWLMRTAMLKRVMKEIGEDIPVWENKISHQHPAFSELDRSLVKFRKWNYQFYTVPEPQLLELRAGGRS